MNYRSSISFHGKRLSWCPRTQHGCWNQPTPQGGFGPGCLNVPEPLAHRCTRKSLLQPQEPPCPSAPTPASHGLLGWPGQLHPLPQLTPGVSKGLLSSCCWLQWEMEWSLCMKGRMKDNIWAVHSVLMGEIPAHSLLTPPICIFSPLGNSGGQIKQVCSGLGEKETPSHHFCVLKWKWHHPLTATLTCVLPAIEMWDNL